MTPPLHVVSSDDPEGLDADAQALADKSISDRTRKLYAGDWAHFVSWATRNQRSTRLPITVRTCCAYLSWMHAQNLAWKTIERRVAGFTFKHREANVVSPMVHESTRKVLRGIRRTARQPRSKRELSPDMVASSIAHLSDRNFALVLIALVTGMRRSELASLQWDHLRRTHEGLVIEIPRSKGDQDGEGQLVAVPRVISTDVVALRVCPVRALETWRRQQQPEPNDPVFCLGPRQISRIIKHTAALAGEDPREFSAHSARAGTATTAARAGVSLPEIGQQTRHRSIVNVAGYVRTVEVSRNPAARAVVDSVAAAATAASLTSSTTSSSSSSSSSSTGSEDMAE